MQGERIYGIYNSVLSLTPNGGSAVDCRPDHVRWDLHVQATLEDATAAIDVWAYPMLVHLEFELTLEIFPSAATAGGSSMAALIDALRTNKQIAVVAAHAPPTGTKKFDKFVGNAITQDFVMTSGKGPVTHRYVLKGQGEFDRKAHDAA